MPELQVTLTGYEEKRGENANGAFVLTKFTADDGKKYQTFDEELAETLKGKIGGGAFGLEFEVQSRTHNGKTFTNNVATGVVTQVDAGGGSESASGGGSAVATRVLAFAAGERIVSNLVASGQSEDYSFLAISRVAENILAWAEGSLGAGDPEDIEPEADDSDAVPD